MVRKRVIIRQIYIDRDIQKPEKSWGWVERGDTYQAVVSGDDL